MKIVFPHMGLMSTGFMGALRNLGVEVVIPSRNAHQSITLSTPHAPETACLPFKMTLGNFIEGLSMGADTIVMIGGRGPCRLGYYSVVQEQILQSLGFDFQIIRTDDPNSINCILATMKEVSGRESKLLLMKNFFFIMNRLTAIDQVIRLAHRYRAYEVNPGQTSHLLTTLIAEIDQTTTSAEVRKVERDALTRFSALPIDPARNPLRIGLIGEIFMVLESFANLNIEETLGAMGVVVTRAVFLSEWFNDRIRFAPFLPRQLPLAQKMARPFLRENVGGECSISIGNAVRFARGGYDGIIHLMPFSCMPEMVAQTILPKVATQFDIPILTLVLDEHAAEVGVLTRLEAFVDMLKRRRGRRQGKLKLDLVRSRNPNPLSLTTEKLGR